VLKADVHGFGSLMRAGADGPVRQALAEAVARWAPPASIAEARDGDAVLIVDDDPVALAQTARHLMDEVYQAPGQPRLRIALHYGEVQTQVRDIDLAEVVAGGSAILCAARVEPLVEPGQIWATDDFRQQFLQRPSLWRTTPVPAPHEDGRFNARKPGSQEPDLWVRLFRLES
jgi:class 3 adenylate cyclase